MIRNLWTWLQGQIIQDAPPSISACEFDCRAVDCRRGEWERCQDRRRAEAVDIARQAARPTRPGSCRDGGGNEGKA
jgi:hypothetical protein